MTGPTPSGQRLGLILCLISAIFTLGLIAACWWGVAK